MAHVAEYTASASTGKTVAITLSAAVPSGSLCFLAITIPRNTLPGNAYTITDGGGNTWTKLQSGVSTGTGAPLNMYAAIYKATLATGLASGSTVTVTAPNGQTEWAAVLEVFDDTTYTMETGGFAGDGSGTSSSISATLTTRRSSGLVVAAAAWFDSTSTISPASGWTIGATQLTSGVNHNAMAVMWRTVTPGAATPAATLSTPSTWALAAVAYGPSAVGYTVWDGTQEQAVSTVTVWNGTQEVAVFEGSVNE